MALTLTDSTRAPLVLVVDGDTDTREMYEVALNAGGLRVAQSARATDAITQAHTLLPAVVTSEIGLQDIDGCELCERLKNHPRTRLIPVVMVTGWATSDALDRARRAGCDSVLIKPCLPHTLLQEVQRLLKLAGQLTT